MKLITHPVVKLLDHTANPERVIAEAASICYGSATDDAACTKRIQNLMRLHHYATLRFASATFHVSDISISCARQIVRFAHKGVGDDSLEMDVSVLEKSMRYTIAENKRIVSPTTAKWDGRLNELHEKCYDLYMEMLTENVPKEDARNSLLMGTATQMVLTANFQTWLHWLGLRTSTRAQWEIRSVADAIHKELYHLAPNIFGDENVKS